MKTILVPVDFSDATSSTVAAALSLARASGGELFFVHVLPTAFDYRAYPVADDHAWEKDMTRARRDLLRLLADVRNEGIPASCRVVSGEPVTTILDLARASRADVIVMGSHGHGAIYDLLIGSTSSGVMKAAPCPVMITPTPRNRVEVESGKTRVGS